MWWKASCLLRKGAEAEATLKAIEAKTEELNKTILPHGVEVVPFLDRSDLVHYTTHTVLHNLTEGIILVAVILFLFLGNFRGAFIVALTIPFSLLFAAICLSLANIPANLLSLGALDFGMVVEGAVVMMENIIRYLSRRQQPGLPTARSSSIREAAHEVQRPVFYSIGIIITAYVPIFTLQRVEGRLFKPMAWTVSFALLGSLIFSMLIAPVLSSYVLGKQVREWHNPVMTWITSDVPQDAGTGHPLPLGHGQRGRGRFSCLGLFELQRRRSAPNSCRTWMKAPFGPAPLSRPAPAPPRARAS